MNLSPYCASLLAAFCLAAPSSGWSRDHHDGHHYESRARCYPSYGYRGYRPYAYYEPAIYPGYGFYGGPSLGISISPSPSYYRSSGDYDNSADGLAVDVQRALARRGFYRGEIDGDVGPSTRSAIRQYQYRNDLEVTGRIDRSLLRALGLS